MIAHREFAVAGALLVAVVLAGAIGVQRHIEPERPHVVTAATFTDAGLQDEDAGEADQSQSNNDESQRVIIEVNRRKTIKGFIVEENDDLITVRDREGRAHAFTPTRVRRIVHLHDPLPDQRARVMLTNGQVREGILLKDGFDEVVLRIQGIASSMPREIVYQVVLEPTLEEKYRAFKAELRPGMIREHLDLCTWLMEHEQYELARDELKEILSRDDVPRARQLLRRVQALIDLKEGNFRSDPPEQPTTDQPSEDAPKKTRSAAAQDMHSRDLISEDDVNIIRVYEIDLENPPKITVPPETVRRLIQDYGTHPELPSSRRDRNMMVRADPVDLVELMFRLRARELYPEIQVNSEPAAMNQFRRYVHDTWLINNCATSRCHGGPDAGRLFLHNRNYKQERVRYTNFLTLERLELDPQWPLINYDEPLMSVVIQHALPRTLARLPHPDVDGWRPVFQRGQQDELRRSIDWITTMMQPRPQYPVDYQPPTIDASTADPEPDAETDAEPDPEPDQKPEEADDRNPDAEPDESQQ